MENFVYRRPNHLSHLERLRDHCKLCDVTIQIDGQRFNAHKLILAATVPFFEKMFTTDFREQKDGLVVLKNIKANNMELFLMFAYTGEINLNKDNAESLMFDADFLGLTDLADECAKFLESCIDNENVLAIKKSAELLKYDVLQEKCVNYVAQNFLNFEKTDQFSRISIVDLEKITKNRGLKIASEAGLYKAMMRWLDQDVNERKQYLPRLLKCVRLTRLTAEYLINDILRDELIATSEECKDIINEVIYSRIILNERMSKKVMYEVTSCNKHRIVIQWHDRSMLLVHDPETDSWQRFNTDDVIKKQIHASAVLKGELYSFDELGSILRTIINYDNRTCHLKKIGKTKSQRCFPEMVALGSYLFICGGILSHEGISLNFVERYCPQTGECKTVAPMNTSRSYFRAVAYQGCIYACGGIGGEGNSYLSSIECYDPFVDKWTIIDASMTEARSSFGMAVFNDKIYICGGENDLNKGLDTIEVFDPKLNTCEYVCLMDNPKLDLRLFAYQEKLWAIGGDSVDLYDPATNAWKRGESLPYCCYYLIGGVVVIAIP